MGQTETQEVMLEGALDSNPNETETLIQTSGTIWPNPPNY